MEVHLQRDAHLLDTNKNDKGDNNAVLIMGDTLLQREQWKSEGTPYYASHDIPNPENRCSRGGSVSRVMVRFWVPFREEDENELGKGRGGGEGGREGGNSSWKNNLTLNSNPIP